MTDPSLPNSSPTPGRIITFYSYKGGTGRSMAVANVAWILASQGKRVLVIDWDLEAPGLHRYFHPFIEDTELSTSPGVIDFLVDFVEGSRLSRREQGESENDRWFESYTDLLPYAFSLDWEFPNDGTLDFVPAGRQGPGYGVRVMTFDWQGFYDKLGGGVFLEAVKQRLRAEYDYILIDSRTGISDSSGICTVQMPNDLVVCFTLNNQSIRGAVAVAESAFTQRRKPTGEPGLRIWLVPTRVELGEKAKLELARTYSRSQFDRFLDHLRLTSKEEYWGRVETLYFPWYAYEEVLATFGDRPKESNSLLAATERLTAYLTDGEITELVPPSEEERIKVRDQFARGQSTLAPQYDVFVSYSYRDREWVTGDLLQRLEKTGLKVLADHRDFQVGMPTLVNLEQAIEGSRHILMVLTPAWVQSQWSELETVLINTEDGIRHMRKLVPLMLEKCELPPRIAMLTYADFTDPSHRSEQLARLLRTLGAPVPETAARISPAKAFNTVSGSIVVPESPSPAAPARRRRRVILGVAVGILTVLLSLGMAWLARGFILDQKYQQAQAQLNERDQQVKKLRQDLDQQHQQAQAQLNERDQQVKKLRQDLDQQHQQAQDQSNERDQQVEKLRQEFDQERKKLSQQFDQEREKLSQQFDQERKGFIDYLKTLNKRPRKPPQAQKVPQRRGK